MEQTPTTTATYCGQWAEFYELLTAGAAGVRVHVHTWLEDGKQGQAGTGRVRVLRGPHNKAECLFTRDFTAKLKGEAVAEAVAFINND